MSTNDIKYTRDVYANGKRIRTSSYWTYVDIKDCACVHLLIFELTDVYIGFTSNYNVESKFINIDVDIP